MKDYKKVMLGSVATSALLLGAGAATTPALAGSAEVGHKKGSFYIKSKDGKFSVITGARIQFLYTYQDNDDENTGDASSSDTSFNARRVRFGVKGRAGHKKLSYKVGLNISTNSSAGQDGDDSGLQSTDTYLKWKFSKAAAVTAGVWKQRFTESHTNGSGALTFVDMARGTSNLLRIERDVGVGLSGKIKTVGYELSIINGNTRKSPTNNKNQSVHAHVRIEPFGKFGKFYEGDRKHSKKLKVIATAAGFYKDNVSFSTRGNQNTFMSLAGNADVTGWAFGAAAKWRGLSVAGEYAAQRFRDADGSNVPNSTTRVAGEKAQAWNIEASYFVMPKKWSVAARYERFMTNTYASKNPGTVGATDTGGERRWGLATSYHFNGHANKVTADWIVLEDNNGATDSTGALVRSEDNRFRVQWQVGF
jgi:hypothetical protein